MKHVIAILFMLLLGAQCVQVSLNASPGTYAVSIDEEHASKVSKGDRPEVNEVITDSFTYAPVPGNSVRTTARFVSPDTDDPYIDKATPPPNASC